MKSSEENGIQSTGNTGHKRGVVMTESGEIEKILAMFFLLACCCILAYYFHHIFNVETVFTHFFYIPIILAAIWWRRRGVTVAVFLIILLISSHDFTTHMGVDLLNDFLRAIMFVVVSLTVAELSTDITEHKRVEEKLAESEKRFRSLFEDIVDPVILANPQTRQIVDCNNQALKMMEYPKKKLFSMRADELHPEDVREKTMEGFRKQAKGELHVVDTEVVTKSGKRIPVSINTSMVEIDGKLHMVGIFRDITERKRVEESLKMSEEKFRELVRNIPQKIFTKDINLTYISCNENFARDLGINQDEIKGKKDYDFFPKELADKYMDDDRRIMKNGEIENIEELYILDGQDVWVNTIKAPLRDEQGNIIGILGIFWDITERKKLELELKQKNQELEDYTYTVSHDLKTPLVTIQGFAELLNAKYADQLDDKAKHYLDRITQGTNNLGALVSSLLELSRAGRKTRPFEWHDLNEILEVSLEGLEGKLMQKNVKITHPDNLPEVHCDDLRMEQVLSNLIGNSVKYMGDQPEPEVEIGWKENVGHYTFWVKDNGIGIREEDRDRIFKVFERAETGFDEEGNGIGLSIVKKIMQVHGGDVWVESEAGKGSTFYFELLKTGVEE